ncbi:MAG TPA: shikimate dehydrogenase [Xanthobacteraceae bacterium]|nr:shikimate dehydrogenase [Xanthobacteraceae bacterium]
MGESFRAACIIGWPAGHSRSPIIHKHWIARYGIVGDYRREAVPPAEFAEFVRHLRARGYVGANVTLPHKEAALALSRPDDRARAVGAANTLWFEGDHLLSTNTDVEGFLENLDAATPEWDRGRDVAVVLGAGGAARAVVFGLLERRVGRIHLVNRTPQRAEAMAAQFGGQVRPAGWSELNAVLGEAGLLVNTTSLGMKGEPDLDIDIGLLRPEAVVADIVYTPLETRLLAAAERRGLRTADGLGMLLHQAVRGFSLWFGIQPQVTGELRALVEADLIKA